ncbi:MAG: HDIG domain-containing protein [Acidimicrobiia bacterium]|nr:HDIG domain-containing protein [Acidimicrobiia bacterium]
MPGSWTHLTARFFDVVTARPLNTDEDSFVDEFLSPVERSMFDAQNTADQRHGVECGLDVASTTERRDLVRAAILHDVGKRHVGLGAVGRVLASVVTKLGLPARGAISLYRSHGEMGAQELEETGAEKLVVDFVRHHHSERPPTVSQADWEVLVAADHARVRRGQYSAGGRSGASA